MNDKWAGEFFAYVDEENAFLESHGWTVTEEGWLSPSGVLYDFLNASTNLTLELLRNKGWRKITEIKHIGKKDKIHVNKWARYQSPTTKRLYTFLDAQCIMKKNWDETIYPEGCCGATIELNRLAGDNFAGDLIETWLYREEDKVIVKLWEG